MRPVTAPFVVLAAPRSVASFSGPVIVSLQKYNRGNLHEVVGVLGSSHLHSACNSLFPFTL